MATLHELITKVIPLKGILRIPSYWMREVLTAIADAVEAVNTKIDSKVKAVHTELAHKDESLTKAIFYAKAGQPFFILNKGTRIVVDGREIQAEPHKVYKAESLSFGENTSSVDFLISLNIPAISFRNCTALTSLDLSSFDTSAVTSMSDMFNGCSSLTSLDVSNFDTSAVTNMGSMFSGCSSLTSLDLSSFDTSAITSISEMFRGCNSLTSLDVSNFDTSAITDIRNAKYMFEGCTALKNIKCKQAFKDWCVTNADTISLRVANITWEIVQ